MQPYEVHQLLAESLARLDAPPAVKQRLDRNIRALAAGQLPPPRQRDRVDPRYLVHCAFFLEGGIWHAFKFWINDQSKPGVWLFQAATYRTRPAV
ncbi:MAG TPA: hypothetical protein VG013_32590 [Gemmataceae bacterium]|nr:hypothetical protein [Gemmataceae bacterium]